VKRILTIVCMVVALQLLAVSAIYAAPPAQGDTTQQGGYGGGTYYTVQWGDTLFSIGRMFGVYPYYIAEVNGLQNPHYIYAGQVLYIPPGGGWNGGCGQQGCGGCNPQPCQYPGYQQSSYQGGCGQQGCGGCGNQGCYNQGNSGYYGGNSGCGQQGCYNQGCGQQGCGAYPTPYQGSYQGCGNQGCNNQGCGNQGCGTYGYDYTGYYYGNYYNNYSHTCGYYNNCW